MALYYYSFTSLLCSACWFALLLNHSTSSPLPMVTDPRYDHTAVRHRRSLQDRQTTTVVMDIGVTADSTTLEQLDTETKYRLVEQTLTVLEQLVASLENLGRKTRESKGGQTKMSKMTVGSGLLQQLDNLEKMMRRERMVRRLDHLKTVKQKLLELG